MLDIWISEANTICELWSLIWSDLFENTANALWHTKRTHTYIYIYTYICYMFDIYTYIYIYIIYMWHFSFCAVLDTQHARTCVHDCFSRTQTRTRVMIYVVLIVIACAIVETWGRRGDVRRWDVEGVIMLMHAVSNSTPEQFSTIRPPMKLLPHAQ